ncbi:LysR family transcriptional regulator [Xanthomonas hyacinthi]|uniref:LysR family transcriptional regulator n=1 Tax=Xanthomonas hyacinthi TaxID=56455 RepID=A0A2S7F1Z8_9XANT|nr:LysR family transcriptional regulator [Xanthomonas hyacinthi]PPU99372.1 LysR family transcriptional regulator [Xanthomonas hyacinthi]QGY78365.1 LysR family transcriptional regulator [Xanthomonas hyacinthi]
MHLQGLDLNLLVSLDALLSERNVTRASERLHVSQPAMSAALHKLRYHFTDPLLEKVGRQLELTARGRSLAGPVKELLLQIRGLLDTDATFDPQTADRSFRIIMSGFCAEVFGVPFMQEFARIAPHCSCQLDELTSDLLSRLHEGQADLCVTVPQRAVFDQAYATGEICEQILFRDRFVLVGAIDNPVLARPVDYATFCKQPYVDVRFGGKVISTVEQELRRQAERPHSPALAPSFLHAMSMVSGTELVTIVPFRLHATHGERLMLKAVPVPLQVPELDEIALWHPRSELDPGHRWLRELMFRVAAQMPPLATPSTAARPRPTPSRKPSGGARPDLRRELVNDIAAATAQKGTPL